MKRQSKRATSGHDESKDPGDSKLLPFPEEQNLLLTTEGEVEETEMDEDVDDDTDDDPAGGRGAGRSPCGLGEKKRRLALDQVRALERSFETDNKLDPDRKSRIARDLGLQPRQVAVWFQNRRARWKTKQLERDFAALRARHDALRADCDALRRDKDALAAEIRELRQKLCKPETTAPVKVEAVGTDAVEAPLGASATNKDGSSDSDSSVVFNNDVEAPSPYFEQPFAGFGGSFVDSASAAPTTMGCSPLLPESSLKYGTKWQQHSLSTTTTYPCDSSYRVGTAYGFTEEWLVAAGSDVISSDAAVGFFPDEHASTGLNFGWCASGAEGWD